MGLKCYFPHDNSFADCDIEYHPLKNRPTLQKVEGAHLCCLTLGEVCQILPRVRRQGSISGLQKWLEEKDEMVVDVAYKEKLYYLMFQCRKCLGMG